MTVAAEQGDMLARRRGARLPNPAEPVRSLPILRTLRDERVRKRQTGTAKGGCGCLRCRPAENTGADPRHRRGTDRPRHGHGRELCGHWALMNKSSMRGRANRRHDTTDTARGIRREAVGCVVAVWRAMADAAAAFGATPPAAGARGGTVRAAATAIRVPTTRRGSQLYRHCAGRPVARS